MYRVKGTITVFLSLISVILLSLVCTAVESVRIQGCRSAAVQALDMGIFSVMGEYERNLLEQYDVLLLNCAGADGIYAQSVLEEKLLKYLSYYGNGREHLIALGNFYPWKLEMQYSGVSHYQLATDGGGIAFLQEVVDYETDNLAVGVIEQFMDYKKTQEGQESQKNQAQEVQNQNQADASIMEEEAHKLEQDESVVLDKPANAPEDPREEIKKIKSGGILNLVVGDPSSLSTKSIDRDGLVSRRVCRVGNWNTTLSCNELMAKACLGIYEKQHFYHYGQNSGKNRMLDYQMEYIITGKTSDIENLKTIAAKLLWMREGVNFIYAWNHPLMNQQATGLAAALVGYFGIPGLITITKAALLLAWAYGESLLDVRILLAGKKAAVAKSEATWQLTLDQLAHLSTLLRQEPRGCSSGFDYQAYLNMLFMISNLNGLTMRTLDLIESNIRQDTGMSQYRMDSCVTAIEAESIWRIPGLFFRVPNRFLGLSASPEILYQTKGVFQY